MCTHRKVKLFLLCVLLLCLQTACAMERDGADHARQHATVLAKLLCCFRCCLRQHPHEREVVHVSEPAIPAVSNAVPLSPAGSASAAAASSSSVVPEHVTSFSPDDSTRNQELEKRAVERDMVGVKCAICQDGCPGSVVAK